MKNKKVVLITIIVLLCIFAPLSVIGFIFKGDRNLLDENPKHETYYKGKIWFYDESDKYLSSYECQTEICEISKSSIDDDTYGINYYKGGNEDYIDDNKNFTFITDGSVVYLYSITNGNVMQSYKALKNYNTKIEDNSYIIQSNEGLWGVITVSDTLNSILPFNYDFIALKDNINSDNLLSNDKFIVFKDNNWYILDKNNTEISAYYDKPIIDYNNEYIICKKDNKIYIYDYDKKEFLEDLSIDKYIINKEYIGVISNNILYIYSSLEDTYIKSITLPNNVSDISLDIKEDKIDVLTDNKVIESIELS